MNELGGLFRQMPVLAVSMAILVLAVAGVLPTGLFYGFMGMLTAAPEALSLSSTLIFFTWFASSWYLFRFMQRVLFGPHRQDLIYEKLKPGESTIFALVIGALVILGVVPHIWIESLVTQLATAIGGAA